MLTVPSRVNRVIAWTGFTLVTGALVFSCASGNGDSTGVGGGTGGIGEGGVNTTCSALGSVCVSWTDCCSTACSGVCVQPSNSGSCAQEGGMCTTGTDCCSGNCAAGLCVIPSCTPDGEICATSATCCNNDCLHGTCGGTVGCGQTNASCMNFGDCCALECIAGKCGATPIPPTPSMMPGPGGMPETCETDCELSNMTSFQEFSVDELGACACQGGPCAGSCAAQCAMQMPLTPASACGACLTTQEGLAQNSACTVAASMVCSGVPSCAPFVTCIEACMPSGGLPPIPPLPIFSSGDAGAGDSGGGSDSGGGDDSGDPGDDAGGGPTQGTQSTPTQSTPTQSTPVQSAPVQSAPVQSAPVESSPVQASGFQGGLYRHRRSAWHHIYMWLRGL